MTSERLVPASCVFDAVAVVDGAGALEACNEPMERWLERCGRTLEALPIDASERAELESGAPVLMHVDEEAWEITLRDLDGRRWLTARDVSDREQRQATAFASMRSRMLGELAASLAHDLNNQFHAALALSGELSYLATDPEDVQSIRDLERSTQVGATAIGALSRMLSRTPARRERVPIGDVLEEALAMMRKAYQQAGVELTVDIAAGLPEARLVQVDVVHALCAVLETVLGMKPSTADLAVRRGERVHEEARPREHVAARFSFCGLSEQDAAAVAATVVAESGSLRRLIQSRGALQGLLAAAFLQRRLGGDLSSEASGDRLSIEFSWPVAR